MLLQAGVLEVVVLVVVLVRSDSVPGQLRARRRYDHTSGPQGSPASIGADTFGAAGATTSAASAVCDSPKNASPDKASTLPARTVATSIVCSECGCSPAANSPTCIFISQ